MSSHGIYDMKDGFIPDCDRDPQTQPQTNADRIRKMTDEELANILTKINHSVKYMPKYWLVWLKQEAE